MLNPTICIYKTFPHSAQAAKKFEEEGVDDLVLLPKVTNEGIMVNLHKRYTRDRIYVCPSSHLCGPLSSLTPEQCTSFLSSGSLF